MILRTALSLSLATLAGCIHVSDESTYDPYTYEVEPNDFAFQAQGIGPIRVGERFLIRGHASDQGYDPFDGFAFMAVEPMDVEFALYADDPFADFDVELYDPYSGGTIASWETGANPESGVFSLHSAGLEFHLVVSSFVGSGGYTLEVRGAPLTWTGVTASAPFSAQATARRSGRTVDWTTYGTRKNRPEALPEAPRVQWRSVQVDPETGVTRTVEVRQYDPLGEPSDER